MAHSIDLGVDSIITDLELKDIPWTGGRRLFDWWQKARGSRTYPSRAEFSPTIMGEYLPSMVLHDVGGDARSYDIRLAGTEIATVYGADPTGAPLDRVPKSENLRARYDWVLENRKPYICLNLPANWANKDYKDYSTLVMPLGPNEDTIDMLIAHVYFAPSHFGEAP